MRRRRRSDSEDSDYRSKRDRVENDTVESLIYRVGSKDTMNIERDLSELTTLILSEIPRNAEMLIKVIVKCVENIPERMMIYATIVGLLNLKNRSFVGQIIEVLQRELKDSIKSACFEDAKYIILFLSMSVNCCTVSINSILSLYENFAEATLDVGRSLQCRTDWYTYTILYGLPYSGHLLALREASALTDILGTVDVYMTKRQKHHVPLLRVWESDDPHPQEDYLECLWAQILNLRAAGWKEKVTWRLYDAFPSLKELGQPHNLSPLAPPDHDTGVIYPMARVVFRMFDYTDVIDQDDEVDASLPDGIFSVNNTKKETPVLPGAHTIERFMIDEQLSILMNNLTFNRVLCAKSLLNLRTRANVALDYMIIEAVFAGMFNLPKPPVQHGNLLFYGSLLIQLCQEASNTMPLVLAQATGILYERLNDMKPVCIGRFIEWFSYHLSNYQLQWSWKEWSDAVLEDPMSPHRRMITETFARLIRFSYYDNVKRLLPRSFYPLLPPEPVVVNKYNANSELRFAYSFYQLHSMLLNRSEPRDILKRAQRASLTSPHSSSNSDASDLSDNQGPRPFASSDDDVDDGPKDENVSETESVKRRKTRPRVKGCRRLPVESQPAERLPMDPPDAYSNVESRLTDLSCGVTSLPLELFFSALFIAGHKTISHTFVSIKRNASVIRSLASTVESQVEALHVLQAVWINHPQMIVIITEHMCRVGLLDPEAIIHWAYSPIMTSLTDVPPDFSPTGARPQILDFYVWECLTRTLVRVGRRVARITRRLEAAKESMEILGRRSVSTSPERNDDNDDDRSDEDGSGGGADDSARMRDRRSRSKRRQRLSGREPAGVTDRRDLMAGCELISSDDEAIFGSKGGFSSGSQVARLEEARCEAVRSQCAVITLLLHRHARLTAKVASEIAGDGLSTSFHSRLSNHGEQSSLSHEALQHIAFWVKGRLVQVVLEHCDQLIPYLDNLDEFICGAHPEVQDVFEQLRSLHA